MAFTSGEFAFIAWLRERGVASSAVPLGIGDDAALIRLPAAGEALVTVDMLLEGVHFDLSSASPEAVGRKSLAVNLSDIAAMAGRPLAAFVSVALPRTGGRELAEQLSLGIESLAAEFGVAIAGGDTNSWNGPLVVNVAVIGEPGPKGPVLRSGARPGDWLLVTGALGGSLSGRHLRFRPRVDEAQWLHAAAELHALIDLSDGLVSDVRHILAESGVGAVIDAASLPIHADVDASLPPAERVRHALCDGEDFELLLAVGPDDARRLLSGPGCGVPLTRVGEIIEGTECLLCDLSGAVRPLPAGGWEHSLD